MKDKSLHFYFFAYAALGKGLSGSDRIFIELAKRWSRQYPIDIFVWQEGYDMCKREHLNGNFTTFHNVSMSPWRDLGFFINYIARIVLSVKTALFLKLENNTSTMLYSASDFWMDALPGFILKKRFPSITWIGSFYLAAPNPFRGYREEGKLKIPSIKGIGYYLLQQPMYLLLQKYADIIFVTSEPDINRFPQQKKKKTYYIIRGGVNVADAKAWSEKLAKVSKIYDAVFMGRFHPQKGILELIDIWKVVTEKMSHAMLVMIGDGPLMNAVKEKIQKLKLTKNIRLKGYVFDGEEKYKAFAQSKIFLHPAIYDSGGMAAAEGMAWKLPGISFDLEALRTYYPKGMIKVPLHDITTFGKTILQLLHNKKLYDNTSKDAYNLIINYWDWDKRAGDTLKFLENYAK